MPTETIETQAVAVREHGAAVKAEDFMPLMGVDQAVQRKGMINQFIAKVLTEGEDYGKMPGGQTKKVLMKPGAEKLCSIFGLSPRYVKEVIVEDWTGAAHGEPLFSYEYRCQLYRGDRFMGEAIGSCNSWEEKYRYRWVQEDQVRDRQDFDRLPKRGSVRTIFEPVFALDKRETDGKYGKPAQYWDEWQQAITDKTARFTSKMLGKKEYDGWERQVDTTVYRIPNPAIADVINTCQKMAQKRALVAAVLVVTNCSDAFTQDLEEQMGEPEPEHVAPKPAPEKPREKPKPGDDNLKQILAKVLDFETALKATEAVKKGIHGMTGDDSIYYGVLGAHGVEHATELKELAEMKAVITELYWRGVSVQEKMQSAPKEEVPA